MTLWQLLPGGSPLDATSKVGAIVTEMRKRKGIKVEVPGYENVSCFFPLSEIPKLMLTCFISTMTSCKRLHRIIEWIHYVFGTRELGTIQKAGFSRRFVGQDVGW